MNKREQALIDAIKAFYKNKEKVGKMVVQLHASGDLSKEAFDEFMDEPATDISRAKTVMPKPEMSDPPEYDRCGGQMSKDEVIRKNERIALLKKEREEEARRPKPSFGDGCGRQASYC